MFRFKTSHLLLMVGLIAPIPSYAANFCIKVNGGFGSGGSSFVGKGFALPTAGNCKPWAGYVKTASTVIANSTGAGCLSSDGKVLTLTIISTDPSFLGTGRDRNGSHPVVSGRRYRLPDWRWRGSIGDFLVGPAAKQTCSASLLSLPAIHD